MNVNVKQIVALYWRYYEQMFDHRQSRIRTPSEFDIFLRVFLKIHIGYP